MAFSTRRGRPVKEISEKDRGTPELQHKRQFSQTTEFIDLLLHRRVISADQHWCALHYRWLYTLRYGAPTVQSMDPAYVRGILYKKIYQEWQDERETEWRQAQDSLEAHRLRQVVLNASVYNEALMCRLSDLRVGLDLLVAIWCKNTP